MSCSKAVPVVDADTRDHLRAVRTQVDLLQTRTDAQLKTVFESLQRMDASIPRDIVKASDVEERISKETADRVASNDAIEKALQEVGADLQTIEHNAATHIRDLAERVEDSEGHIDKIHAYLSQSENRVSMSSFCIAIASATWASIVAASWIYVLHK